MADETEKIIELVREHPYLYDGKLPEYKDVMQKAKTWTEIAKKLDQKVEIVKLKWRNLRDSYLKYLKFMNGTPGSAKKFKNWPWASNLEFLRDIVSPRKSKAPQFETIILEDFDIDDDCGATEYSPSPPPPKKRKLKQHSSNVHTIKRLDKKKEKKHSNTLDRTDNLFLSYAETFKKLSPRTQVFIKMKLARMFAQAELREMNARSPPSSLNSNYSSWQTTTVYSSNSPEGIHDLESPI